MRCCTNIRWIIITVINCGDFFLKMEQIKRANRLYTNDSIFLKKTLYIPILTEPRDLFNGLDSEVNPPPHPTPVFLTGKSHGQRNLAGCVHGIARVDTTWQLNYNWENDYPEYWIRLPPPWFIFGFLKKFQEYSLLLYTGPWNITEPKQAQVFIFIID